MATKSQSAITPTASMMDTANQHIAPYEPNYEDNEISDMDLLSALCGVQVNVTNISTNSVTSTSNVVTTTPCAMFVNCQIGSINITIAKK